MHELSFAQEIVSLVAQEARDLGVSRVVSVTVTVGRLMAVETDNLWFGLDVLKSQFGETSQTVFLVVEQSVRLHCSHCGQTTDMQNWTFACETCGSHQVEVVAGDILEVTDMEVADETEGTLETMETEGKNDDEGECRKECYGSKR